MDMTDIIGTGTPPYKKMSHLENPINALHAEIHRLQAENDILKEKMQYYQDAQMSDISQQITAKNNSTPYGGIMNGGNGSF